MTIVIKPSNTVRINTTTLAADPDLQFPLLANHDYFVRGKVWFSAKATPDIKIAFDGGGCSGTSIGAAHFVAEGMYAMAGNGANQDDGPIIVQISPTWNPRAFAGSDTANTRDFYFFEMLIHVTGTPGTFSVYWAQNTLDAVNAATVHAGSCMEYFDLSDSSILSVVKSVDENRSTAAVAIDSELTLSLAADSYYWLDCGISATVGASTFNRGLSYEWRYTGGTVQAPMHLQERRTRMYSIASGDVNSAVVNGLFDRLMGTESAITASVTNARGTCIYSGILHTDAAGDYELWWHGTDNGGSPGAGKIVQAGSFIMAREIQWQN
jgi:hypothetical protein